MSNLNWVDYIILFIFFFSMLSGFARGFVREFISLATLIAAFFIAAMFANPLAEAVTTSSTVQGAVSHASSSLGVDTTHPVSYIALGLSFAILFSGTVILGAIIGFFINLAFATGILGLGNRILGAIFGLARGYIFNLALIFVVQLTPLGSEAAWHHSSLVNAYQPAVQWLGNIVSPALSNLKEKFGETFQKASGQIQGITNTYGPKSSQ